MTMFCKTLEKQSFVKFLHNLLSNVWFGQCFVKCLPALFSVLLIQMACYCNYMDLRDACCRSVRHWSIISKGSTWALSCWTQLCIEHYIMYLASMNLNILCDECVGLLSCSCKPWSIIQFLGAYRDDRTSPLSHLSTFSSYLTVIIGKNLLSSFFSFTFTPQFCKISFLHS